MTLSVVIGDPHAPESTALLQASHALMLSLFDPESCHFLSIDALCVPEITFFEGRIDGVTRGCCAIARKDGYGEIKSMFVDPSGRGSGLADAMLEAIFAVAREEGISMLKLETGTLLTAAHKVYQRHGFTFCGSFGDYAEHLDSLFMEKPLP